MMNSTPRPGIPVVRWRRFLLYGACGLAFYVFSAGPVTRFAPELADALYAPIRPLANVPALGSAIRGWVSLWGVDVGE
jgi:hypothetical protein